MRSQVAPEELQQAIGKLPADLLILCTSQIWSQVDFLASPNETSRYPNKFLPTLTDECSSFLNRLFPGGEAATVPPSDIPPTHLHDDMCPPCISGRDEHAYDRRNTLCIQHTFWLGFTEILGDQRSPSRLSQKVCLAMMMMPSIEFLKQRILFRASFLLPRELLFRVAEFARRDAKKIAFAEPYLTALMEVVLAAAPAARVVAGGHEESDMEDDEEDEKEEEYENV